MTDSGRTSAGGAPKARDVRFFETAADLRDWLAANHETTNELWLGIEQPQRLAEAIVEFVAPNERWS